MMQEYELNNILEQYDLTINSTRKTRGAILCETNCGLMLLREIAAIPSRTASLCDLYEYLKGCNELTVDYPIRNKEESYITGAEGNVCYMMRTWMQGRECDVFRTSETLGAVRYLAKIHLALRGYQGEGTLEAPHIFEEYERHNCELRKVRKFMRTVSPKGKFEQEFLGNFDRVYEQAEVTVGGPDRELYERLLDSAQREGHITHREYNHHNILVTQRGLMVTNFDRFRMNIQTEDLYYFMRKVMEKNNWKVKLADHILNAYSAVKPITADEMKHLQNRFSYPEKFWKIANAYQRSNKAWISRKNLEKLQTALRQGEEKKKFLEDIFSFHTKGTIV